jgi:pyruvate dehydrogenase E2 component (dihydrolipoamide acetyltransferase)
MKIEFKLPELGENITNADVVRVLVREGEVIAANDSVVELETEKAVVELPCPHAGKVAKIHVAKGQTIKVGQPLLTIESEDAESALAEKPKTESGKRKAEAVAKAPTVEAQAPSPTVSGPEAPLPAGPESRRLARELGVDLSHVQGTGKQGRITPEDVRAAASAAALPASAPASPHPNPLPTNLRSAPGEGTERVVPPGEPGQDAYGPVRRERMSRVRRTIAAQMVKSASTIPHVTNFDDADVTDLENIRKTIPPEYVGPTAKLTALPFAVKAIALALRQHPTLNASLDEEKEEVVYKQYVNVGVAVDTPRGLVVPVLRNADQRDVFEIARELTAMAARARAVEFSLDDLRGGTFTVSNLGAVGGAYSTPIINHPEVAILLLGRSRWLLRMREGAVENRLMMPLSISYDHRVVDGATAGRFLNRVIDYLQSPGKLLFAG